MDTSLETFAGPQSGRRLTMTFEAQLAAEAQRVEERRRWLAGIRAKVHDGRWDELTPEERGWLEAKLISDA